MNSERSQNVCGQRREAERGEEALAVAHHLLRVVPSSALQALGQVVARVAARAAPPAGRCCPTPAPTCCRAGARGSGPSAGTTSGAVLLAQLARARRQCSDVVERPHLLPQPVDLRRERRRAACRTSSATSRPCPRSPARARPCWPARRSARSRSRIGGEIACQPCQASSSSFGSRLSARIRLSALMSRHSCARRNPRRRAGSTCPCRTAPSIAATMRVSSAACFGSLGAGRVSASFRSFSLRAVSAGSSSPSKRVACLA